MAILGPTVDAEQKPAAQVTVLDFEVGDSVTVVDGPVRKPFKATIDGGPDATAHQGPGDIF